MSTYKPMHQQDYYEGQGQSAGRLSDMSSSTPSTSEYQAENGEIGDLTSDLNALIDCHLAWQTNEQDGNSVYHESLAYHNQHEHYDQHIYNNQHTTTQADKGELIVDWDGTGSPRVSWRAYDTTPSRHDSILESTAKQWEEGYDISARRRSGKYDSLRLSGTTVGHEESRSSRDISKYRRSTSSLAYDYEFGNRMGYARRGREEMEMGIEFPPHAHVGQGKRGVRVDKELPALPVPVPRGGGNMYAYAHTPHTQTRTQTQNQKQGMRGSYGPRQRASGYRVHPQTHTHGRNYADEKYRDSTHTHTQKQTQKRKSKLLGFVEKIIGALFGENDRRGNKKGKKTSEKWVR